MSCIFLFISTNFQAQNILDKKVSKEGFESILINGNQIFKISVSTATTDYITISSILDGEYQNQFQIITKQENNQLKLSLERLEFSVLADDKRNAHKVIAATLTIEIPENLSLSIISDIGSVGLNGNFDSLLIELLRGHCEVIGKANSVTINTIDGDINVVTQNASISASSSHGNVVLDEFSNSESFWKLQSINGDITVAKQE